MSQTKFSHFLFPVAAQSGMCESTDRRGKGTGPRSHTPVGDRDVGQIPSSDPYQILASEPGVCVFPNG